MDNAESQVTTEVVPEALRISQYEALEGKIAEAVAVDAKAEFNYRDPIGNKQARSYVSELRTLRADIGRAHKDAKAVALEYGRRVDAVKKELEAKVTPLIERHASVLDAIKQEEDDRIAAHTKILQQLMDVPHRGYDSSAEAEAELMVVANIDTSAMDEFAEKAAGYRDAAVEFLERIIPELKEVERKAAEEAAKIEADRAELEKLRQQQAEREMADRVAREEKERALKAEREAEEAKQREAKAQAEAEAAKKRAAELEAQEAARIEREKAEAEAKAQREAEAAAELERNRQEWMDDAIDSLILATGTEPLLAVRIVNAIADGRIKHIVFSPT